jgi:hypothetical protein
MRRACAVFALVSACADEPRPSEPIAWPIPLATESEAAPPDLVVRWGTLAALRWPATVEHASGIDIDGPCFVDALTDGPRFRRVVVVCGARVLYDTDRARYGGPVEGATLRERARADQFVYGMSLSHEGDGVRLAVDTEKGLVVVEETSWLGWSLHLAVEPWTDGRNDPPLLLPRLEERSAMLYLRVVDADGPLEHGTMCDVDVMITEAAGEELECAFRVVCDEREVFGAATMGSCALAEGKVTAASIETADGEDMLAWSDGAEEAWIVVDGRRVRVEGGVGSIGVAECDDYLASYRRCLPHVPEGSRSAMERALDLTEEAWKRAAEGPARSSLAYACETARNAVRSSMAAWGCTL